MQQLIGTRGWEILAVALMVGLSPLGARAGGAAAAVASLQQENNNAQKAALLRAEKPVASTPTDADGYVVTYRFVRPTAQGFGMTPKLCPLGTTPPLLIVSDDAREAPYFAKLSAVDKVKEDNACLDVGARYVPVVTAQGALDGYYGAGKTVVRGIAPFSRYETVIYFKIVKP